MTRTPLGRLLIVDDESDLVAALCRILRAEGYATTGAGSGPEALDALRATTVGEAAGYDVLITDLTMPTMDGITLLRAAREIDSDLDTVVMTGHGTIDTAVEAMKSGALDYIVKPFNLSVILPVISRALTVRRLRAQNALLLKQVENRTRDLEFVNRELQAANKELGAFTHTVSHDVRQPLNGVIGFAEFLLSEKPGALNSKQKEFLGDILNGGRQLVQLTADLLQFSRLGHEPLKKETVDITGLVWDLLQSLRNAEPNRNIEVRVGPLPDASADPSLIRQVFANLLSNAFKFTRHTLNPLIEVSGQQEARERVYCIRDNGIGFDMTNARRLFSIFQRLHNEKDFDGAGVGLSIVQRIVERHGGTVSAQAAVGAGAAFTVTLPE
jgi:two-component system sensor histidine kinase/response regulator